MRRTSSRRYAQKGLVTNVSHSEHLPDEVWVEFVCLVAEERNSHGLDYVEHVGVDPKGSKGFCVTEASGLDLGVEEGVVPCCRFLIPSFIVEVEEDLNEFVIYRIAR